MLLFWIFFLGTLSRRLANC